MEKIEALRSILDKHLEGFTDLGGMWALFHTS